MSKSRRKLNIVITIMLLLLAFASMVGTVSAYFSAITHKNGGMSFSKIDVSFAYTDENGDVKSISSNGAVTTLTLFPVVDSIVRNEFFELAVEDSDTAIETISIVNNEDSCDVYVRFWIDAYIIDSSNNVDRTVNYGKYFLLADSNNFTKENGSVANSDCYYVKNALNSASATGKKVDLGNQLMVADLDGDEIPVDMLGAKLKVTISFDAVQAANEAYKSVFGAPTDLKGYYTNWR